MANANQLSFQQRYIVASLGDYAPGENLVIGPNSAELPKESILRALSISVDKGAKGAPIQMKDGSILSTLNEESR